MFDPNAPLPDFQTQSAEVQRQRLIADMLRKQGASQRPEGKMVGGRYIRPNLAEFLPGLLNSFDAGQISRQADTAEKQYGADVSAAKESWASSLPRAVAGVPGRVALPGPPDANGSPELAAREAVPAVLPTREAILKATLAGMRIPGNEKAADLWNRGMESDLVREDTQTARSEAAAAAAQARREAMEFQQRADAERRKNDLEQRERESLRRSEDTRLSIEQRREAAELAAQARRDIAALAAAVASSKGDKPKELKPLPSSMSQSWIKNASGIASVDNALALANKRPKSFGMSHYVIPDAITQRTDPEGVEARAAVANLGSLRIHDRSGAAVTAAETPRLKPFIPSAGDDHATIVKKLEGFRREYMLIQQEILDYAEAQGYKPPGVLTPMPGTDATAAPAGKPETKVINGKTYVKRDGQWYEQ